MAMKYDSNGGSIVAEVRDALSGMNDKKIPDDTITQAQKRFVEPAINDQLNDTVDQNLYDAAVISWTAEKAFDAWLTKVSMADAELKTEVDPEHFKQKLKDRTNQALHLIGVERKTVNTSTVKERSTVTAVYSEEDLRT